VLFWNVDGLYSTTGGCRYNKLNLPHAQAALADACLVGVAELKLRSSETISPVEGFALLHQVTHPAACSGGLAVFVRLQLADQFKVVTNSGADGYVVVRCPGGLQVVFVYFAPERSVVYTRAHSAHPMDVLQGLLDRLRPAGPVVFMGDFNARCGELEDRVDPAVDSLVECLGIDSELQRTHRAGLPARRSMDATHNSRGSELVTLMQVEDVVLMNGRAKGRGNGGFTHSHKASKGQSVVDLCLFSADAYARWGASATLDVGTSALHGDFDHLPLSVTASGTLLLCLQIRSLACLLTGMNRLRSQCQQSTRCSAAHTPGSMQRASPRCCQLWTLC
jgi:exonuclease III